MAIPDMINNSYSCTGSLFVQAPDPATAQAALETAVAAVNALLTGMNTPPTGVLDDTPVTLSVEMEAGQYVLQVIS